MTISPWNLILPSCPFLTNNNQLCGLRIILNSLFFQIQIITPFRSSFQKAPWMYPLHSIFFINSDLYLNNFNLSYPNCLLNSHTIFTVTPLWSILHELLLIGKIKTSQNWRKAPILLLLLLHHHHHHYLWFLYYMVPSAHGLFLSQATWILFTLPLKLTYH